MENTAFHAWGFLSIKGAQLFYLWSYSFSGCLYSLALERCSDLLVSLTRAGITGYAQLSPKLFLLSTSSVPSSAPLGSTWDHTLNGMALTVLLQGGLCLNEEPNSLVQWADCLSYRCVLEPNFSSNKGEILVSFLLFSFPSQFYWGSRWGRGAY